jgi:hypothetical protein
MKWLAMTNTDLDSPDPKPADRSDQAGKSMWPYLVAAIVLLIFTVLGSMYFPYYQRARFIDSLRAKMQRVTTGSSVPNYVRDYLGNSLDPYFPFILAMEFEDYEITPQLVEYMSRQNELKTVRFMKCDITPEILREISMVNHVQMLSVVACPLIDKTLVDDIVSKRLGMSLEYRGIAFFGITFDSSKTECLLFEMFPGGSAERAGLMRGDVITKFDNQEVQSYTQLLAAIAQKSPGDVVEIEYLRNNIPETRTATLDAWPTLMQLP